MTISTFDLLPINPEFKRNIWLNISRERLIAMPLIIAALFWADLQYFQGGHDIALLFLLLVVWGSGLSGDAIFQELRGYTWELQRMTPLGPWSITWGKLLGSTIFVWYGALCCLIAITLLPQFTATENLGFLIAYVLSLGFFAQAFALFTALLFQRISSRYSRARVVYIQFFTIGIVSLLFFFGRMVLPTLLENLSWYLWKINTQSFILTMLWVFNGWLLFGIYRLLRNELAMASLPWGLPLFILFWVFFLNGFWVGLKSLGMEEQNNILGLYYLSAIILTFLGAFFSPKNRALISRFITSMHEKKWWEAAYVVPSWVPSLLITFILLMLWLIHVLGEPFSSAESLEAVKSGISIEMNENIFKQLNQAVNAFIQIDNIRLRRLAFGLSVFLFLLRDISLIYTLNWNLSERPKYLGSLVYLISLYILIPSVLGSLHFPNDWLPLFAPWAWFYPMKGPLDFIHILLILLGIILQIALIGGIWRNQKQKVD